MRSRRLPVAAAAVTAGVLLLPVQVAVAQPAPVTAAPAAEAWFRTLPVQPPAEAEPCTLPSGCPPALPAPLPSPYAAGTLHVGVAGGAEESRTYLALDLSTVGFDSEITGGTLTLPVATDPQAGTAAPETAALRACAVAGSVQDGVDGALTGAPPVDCATSSEAVYAAAEGDAPASYSVDLTPFAESLTAGATGLALVPGEEPGTAWHVAFSRRDREAEGALPISATLRVTPATATTDGPTAAPTVEVAAPVGTGTVDLPPLRSGASFAAPPLAPAEQPLTSPVTPEVAAPTAQVPVAAVLGGPYAYPAVFLLPLLVAAAVGWAGRAFTRDLLPVRA
jgi:hypothetical protein